jgi:ribosomal protein S18 acetylase RimI-like enzyme
MPDFTPLYRPMTAADIDATGYIRKAALEGLAASQGRTMPPWQPQRYPHFDHLLQTDPDGAFVAEIGRTVVGFSMGFVRGATWFLAQLFVQPEVHAHGIGRELLRLAQDAGRARGATIFSVVSSTAHASQSLYMRAGMFGRGIGYGMSGPVDALRTLPEPDEARKVIVDCHGWEDRIADLDREVWSAPRTEEHTLFLSGKYGDNDYSFALNRDGALLGYGYVSEDDIGPLAAHDPADQIALLRIAGDWMTEQEVGQGHIYVISHNATVIGALLECGWRVNGWTFLLSSEPFGDFSRYVPSGGLLL